MHVLFCHQNFPAQFGPVGGRMAAAGHTVSFASRTGDGDIPGVARVRYAVAGGATKGTHYFARTFGIEIVDVIQKTPGKEPTGKSIEKLVAACVEYKVRVIAVEPQYSGQASATRILEELKRKGIPDPVLVEIDPLETAQPIDLNPGWYEAKMRINLENLAKAMR